MTTPVHETQNVRLEILDLLGRVVRTYSLSLHGKAAIEWDGKNTNGHRVPAGIYAYRLKSGNIADSRRLILLH